jgi:serine/threonine-protein kinase
MASDDDPKGPGVGGAPPGAGEQSSAGSDADAPSESADVVMDLLDEVLPEGEVAPAPFAEETAATAGLKPQTKAGPTGVGSQPSVSGPIPIAPTFPFVFGRYTLTEHLGAGGMAEVYRAKQQGPAGFSKDICVKRLLPHLAKDQHFVEMFLHEARLAARLTHGNVVQIYELGEHEGAFFIAMEFIDGLSLFQLARRAWRSGKPLPLELIVSAACDAARGLDYAHRKKDDEGNPLHLVHRDISPDNLMINREGNTKLLDFGVAKVADSRVVTRAGEVKGKTPYMAPEQVRAKAIDGRIGVTLYWLCTGQRPFKGDSDLWLMEAILEEDPKPPREYNPNIPPALESWILSLLEKRPSDRPKSGAEVANALAQLVPHERDGIAHFVADMMEVSEVSPSQAMAMEGGFVAAMPLSAEHANRQVPPPPLATREPEMDGRRSKERPGAKNPRVLAAAAAVVLVLLVGLGLAFGGGDDPPPTTTGTGTTTGDDGTVKNPTGTGDDPPPPPPVTADAGSVAVDDKPDIEPDKEPDVKPEVKPGKKPDKRPTAVARQVQVTAPSHVQWRTTRGKRLGKGSGTLQVPAGTRNIVALDTKRNVRTTLRVASSIRYGDLPKGTLSVRVYPYAEIWAGKVRLGSTPFPDRKVTAGTWTLRLVSDGKTKTERVTVRAGKTSRVKASFQ